ncbi:MAG: putative Ig domain-containing protein [Blastocatellia bacterium]
MTASVVAACTASTASFTLTVTDNQSATANATLNVNVAANTTPTQGSYPGSSVAAGGSTTVTPSVAPSDNGSIVSLTASAPGFTGTLSVNAAGVVSISNANPTGPFTVTVTATDNCGASSTASFSLTVSAANNPPAITGATISRQQGSPASSSQVATVSDADQAANTLVVTVNGSSSATVNGVTVSGIGISAAGVVTASVVASCTASNASFTLTVTDNQSATAMAALTVNVAANTPPSLGTYPATGPINVGASATVTPSAPPSDNGSITGITATAPGFTGTLTVNAAGVVSIANAGPAGTFTVTVTATDNCGAQTVRTFSLTVAATGCNVTVNPATLAQAYVAVPYIQILSASPSGNYTFSVSAGALPPGLQLVTAFGVTSIAGFPTTPGTYNFTIKAKQNNSTCEGTRGYTVTIPTTVVPILECVQHLPNGMYRAYFGYDNTTGAAVTIPVGVNNFFTPGNQNRGQTTLFQPGRVTNAFNVTFKANGSNLAVWFLKGPDGILRPVNVTTASIGCP